MVVGGIFAISKPDTKPQRENKITWRNSINKLVDKARVDNPQFIVPTPVCFELMTMNQSWKNFILDNTSGVFRYAQYGISSSILKRAAEYSFTSRIKFSDNSSYKVKSFDPIIAAYSLEYGFPIITENQKDYCESHFSVGAVEPVILNAQINQERRYISILLPKKGK